MRKNMIYALLTSIIFAGCTTIIPFSSKETQPAVAPVRLADSEMTPVKMIISRDIPANTEVRIKVGRILRPVWSGIFQITNIMAEGTSEPLTLREEKTRKGINIVFTSDKNLDSGTSITLRGRKSDKFDSVRQRYTDREVPVWLEYASINSSNKKPIDPLSKPLVVRTVSGPVHHIEAWQKADGRLVIQAFDKDDNPADDAGATYSVTGEGADAKPLVVPAEPGLTITEVVLPASVRNSGTLTVSDNGNHQCRSSAFPRSIDGRSIFFGDIHTHTSFSDGDYPTEHAIAWARQRMGLDFAGPGDHISEKGDFADQTARDYVKYGRKYEKKGKFCRIPAFELGISGGHQLLCARDYGSFVRAMDDYVKYVGSSNTPDSASFYNAMAKVMIKDKTMVMPVHPIGHDERWPDISDKSHICAAEIIHGGGSHEFHEVDKDWLANGGKPESSIRHALNTGYRLGFIGESDNHRCLPGQPMVGFHGMTAVQAKALDTASIFDAIRNRRCYATSGARIVADASLNDMPIGSEIRIAPTAPRTFKIVVKGTAPIVETQIIHCGNVLKAIQSPEKTYDIKIQWTDIPPASRKTGRHEYYYVRVRQADGHIAFLSPFFVVNP